MQVAILWGVSRDPSCPSRPLFSPCNGEREKKVGAAAKPPPPTPSSFPLSEGAEGVPCY